MNYIQGIPNETNRFPIAIVISHFNYEITRELLQGAMKQLQHYGFTEQDITVVEVPGAVEIPIVAKRLAKKKQHQAIIALGAVIRGETTHYDYVCQQVSQGCQMVALEFEIPVVFGVLTTENEAQAWDRLGGKHGHKGMDAVDCALSMQSVLGQLA
ncbi:MULTISPECIES: 6,7-dimethyl-8-ribityllumazine synthase [Legionella]|uniref:6,7-dimethyl-8-ribityllumazine synthase n=1 Tax=Legionella septentrionalis TaxID=2498109 RepID=A0A433JIG2_9GAMM|nr:MULTISPECIES: 6,7-dimethyl-8-ribityllumazine synthase [Legionella]MCP0913343.1 6,7-dimethyl-8-ribityllumazine synthase [Legionella sp. 27cVA30]RUQ85067.1 6,7-dimethyl-8-ribityllumazine synthase [Legionella septentrionalis]RUQ94306.1 6,7-dimethyl-8-ribityllumazine synthase [Legionella septentrionalis]RUR08587.1 6,7-dimethyl-8-ribityllumazine synthase [Legionella septentrionalis]